MPLGSSRWSKVTAVFSKAVKGKHQRAVQLYPSGSGRLSVSGRHSSVVAEIGKHATGVLI